MKINWSLLWRKLKYGAWKIKRFFSARRRQQQALLASSPQRYLKRAKIGRLIALGSLGAVVMGVVGFFGLFAYYSKDLPKPGEIVRREGFSTKIYDRSGNLLYDLFDEERRTPVKIDQIPLILRQATIAVEDKEFYNHRGFDFMTVLRIPYNILFKQRVVGGSTLTQQLVKNVLLSNERTISRKFKEFVLAVQIERTFTKDEILEMYLNENPYGGTAYGVEAAAQQYFAKSVKDLNLVQAAVLAGLPQRPSAYSPYAGQTDSDGKLLWKLRTQGVLRRMWEDNYISEADYNQALNDVEELKFERQATDIKAPHFVFYVKQKLEEIYGADLVEKGGLKVTTTLNLDLQTKTEEIVEAELAEIVDFHITNGAALVMDPRSGEVVAMVGSRDYFDPEQGGQFNVVTDGLRQPGSSIKPVTYLAMFRQGYHPGSMIVDAATEFRATASDDAYEPQNYDGKFHGPVSLRQSLGSSLNIPAVKSLALVGVKNFLELAYQMGFKTLEPTEENLKRFGLALTLGGGEVHLIDTVTAYSAFANGGQRIEPVAILKVEDRNGKTIFEHKPVTGTQVISAGEAFLINNVLSDNNARMLAFGANSLLNTGKAIAVKTGTTNDLRDNWTIGWSQEVIVGAWVGNNDNSQMKRVASGITGASPIWRQTILAALEAGYGAPDWTVPEDVEQIEVDAISGYRAHDDFPLVKEYVIKGSLSTLPDPIHKKIKVCKGENKLATEARIAAGDYEEREVIDLTTPDPVSTDGENRWQIGINNWIASQSDSRYQVPTEYCGGQEDVTVKLERPKDKESYDEEEIKVRVRAGSDRGIAKIEIYVDGEKKETIESDHYEDEIKMSKGRHTVYAKAYSRSGKEAKSNEARIGTGGEDWEKPEPTDTPKPTSAPSATPQPTAEPTTPVEPSATPEPTGSEAE